MSNLHSCSSFADESKVYLISNVPRCSHAACWACSYYENIYLPLNECVHDRFTSEPGMIWKEIPLQSLAFPRAWGSWYVCLIMNRDRVVRAVRGTSIEAAELEDDLRVVRSLLGTKSRSRDIYTWIATLPPTRMWVCQSAKYQNFLVTLGVCAEYVTHINPVLRGLGLASPMNDLGYMHPMQVSLGIKRDLGGLESFVPR